MLNKKNYFLKTAINGLETRYGSGSGSESGIGTVMCKKSEPEPEPELFKSHNRNRKKLLRFHNAASRRVRRPWHSLSSSSPSSEHRPTRSGTRRTGSRRSQHRPRWFLLFLVRSVSSWISDPHSASWQAEIVSQKRKKFHVWRDFEYFVRIPHPGRPKSSPKKGKKERNFMFDEISSIPSAFRILAGQSCLPK